jgi:hypothetical protein
MRNFIFGTLGLTLSLACSAGGGDGTDGFGSGGAGGLPFGSTGGVGIGSTPFGSGAAPASGQGGGSIIDLPTGSGGAAAQKDCPAITQKAERAEGKADIVIIIDNSLSMVEEAAAVQKNINAFSQQIKASGVDVRVVLISSAPKGASGGGSCIDPTGIACIFVPGLKTGETGICVDPPLGKAGACPTGNETNEAAGFLHVREVVQSNDALQVLQRTYTQWQKMIRPDSAKTFVVVTDDDVRGEPGADAFQQWVSSQALFQGSTWRFSGLYCVTKGPNCFNAGLVYQDLVTRTKGITGDMAQFGSGNIDAQFKTVFDSLANAIVKDAVPVPCQYGIPAPPAGKTFDKKKLNVSYTNGANAKEDFFSVGTPGECSDQTGSWYYDDNNNPTKVVICPQACGRIQADDRATMQIIFDCDTKVLIK